MNPRRKGSGFSFWRKQRHFDHEYRRMISMMCPYLSPPVGEATSLPRSITEQYETGSGEFLFISNFLPFNQPVTSRNAAGGW